MYTCVCVCVNLVLRVCDVISLTTDTIFLLLIPISHPRRPTVVPFITLLVYEEEYLRINFPVSKEIQRPDLHPKRRYPSRS